MTSLDEISGTLLDLSIRVHQALGPGMLESVYETVLAGKLIEMGYAAQRQKPVPIEFEGHYLKMPFGSTYWSKIVCRSKSSPRSG